MHDDAPMCQQQQGFTLIELMIAVAIVGILATVATGELLTMQLRAKRSEVMANLKAIAVSQLAYYELYERFVACSSSPGTPLNRAAHPFDPSATGWSELEWAPDGQVRCHYASQIFTTGGRPWVRAIATCDLDDDNRIAMWWMDVDPERVSSSSQHMTLRPSPATEHNNRW